MEKPENSLDLFDFISERGVSSEAVAKAIFQQVLFWYFMMQDLDHNCLADHDNDDGKPFEPAVSVSDWFSASPSTVSHLNLHNHN